jgi:hypothetical protein
VFVFGDESGKPPIKNGRLSRQLLSLNIAGMTIKNITEFPEQSAG